MNEHKCLSSPSYSHRFLVFPDVQQSSGEGHVTVAALRHSFRSNEAIVSARTLRHSSGSIFIRLMTFPGHFKDPDISLCIDPELIKRFGPVVAQMVITVGHRFILIRNVL